MCICTVEERTELGEAGWEAGGVEPRIHHLRAPSCRAHALPLGFLCHLPDRPQHTCAEPGFPLQTCEEEPRASLVIASLTQETGQVAASQAWPSHRSAGPAGGPASVAGQDLSWGPRGSWLHLRELLRCAGGGWGCTRVLSARLPPGPPSPAMAGAS